jgi:hypothetical protein
MCLPRIRPLREPARIASFAVDCLHANSIARKRCAALGDIATARGAGLVRELPNIQLARVLLAKLRFANTYAGAFPT